MLRWNIHHQLQYMISKATMAEILCIRICQKKRRTKQDETLNECNNKYDDKCFLKQKFKSMEKLKIGKIENTDTKLMTFVI